MRRYSKYINKNTPLDNEIVRAAARFATAIDNQENPSLQDQKIIANAFFQMFGGESDLKLFGKNTGIRTQKIGRPSSSGYTLDEVISAHIELIRRVLVRSKNTNSLVNAKRITAEAFSFSGEKVNVDRAINRHWENGKEFATKLDSRTLRSIINPYCKDKK